MWISYIQLPIPPFYTVIFSPIFMEDIWPQRDYPALRLANG